MTDDPFYVKFPVAGHANPVVAQVWQWDVRPKNPKYPAARFAIGQEVDKDPTNPGVLTILGDPTKIADFVYEVLVEHDDPEAPGKKYKIKYRVVIAE